MSSIAKLCVVCVAEEHDPEDAQLLTENECRCFNCGKLIGLSHGEEVYVLWSKDPSTDGIYIDISPSY